MCSSPTVVVTTTPSDGRERMRSAVMRWKLLQRIDDDDDALETETTKKKKMMMMN